MNSKNSDPLFSSDHLKNDLKRRTIKSGTITLTGQLVRFVLNMGSTIIIARLILPESFGLIVMTQSVLAFVHIFQSFGLSLATVQQKEITHEQTSTLFWVNVAIGTISALFAIAIAPLVSMLFNEPRLTDICMAFSIPIFISAFAAQHGALLHRQMRFATQQAIQIISMIFGIFTVIVAAKYGLDYWSLVLKEVVGYLTTVMMLWAAVRWIPGRPRKGTGVRKMVSFGAHITATSFLETLSKNVDNIIIGHIAGPAALGFYSRAYSLLLLPIRQINAPMRNVALPALSRLQDEPERFRKYYRQGLELMVLVGAPGVAYCYYATEDITAFLLGPNWTETVPLFRALAPAALMGTFAFSIGWALVPLGQTKKLLQIKVFSSIAVVSAFAIGAQWGALGVAYSLSVISVLKYFPEIVYASSDTPLSTRDILSALARPITSALLTCLLLILFIPVDSLSGNIALRLAASFSIFGAAYILILLVLPGGYAFLKDLKITARTFFKKKAPLP